MYEFNYNARTDCRKAISQSSVANDC